MTKLLLLALLGLQVISGLAAIENSTPSGGSGNTPTAKTSHIRFDNSTRTMTPRRGETKTTGYFSSSTVMTKTEIKTSGHSRTKAYPSSSTNVVSTTTATEKQSSTTKPSTPEIKTTASHPYSGNTTTDNQTSNIHIYVNDTKLHWIDTDACVSSVSEPLCFWSIHAPENHVLELTMQVPTPKPTDSCDFCSCGYVAMLEDVGSHAENDRNVCVGDRTRQTRITRVNVVIVYIDSMNFSTSDFTISYRAVNSNFSTSTKPPSTTVTPTVISHDVIALPTSQSVTLPPNLTHSTRNTLWQWKIHSTKAQVEIKIVVLNVSESYDCALGYLEVLDGSSKLFRTCGTVYVTGPVRSSSPEMTIIYRPSTDTVYGLRFTFKEVQFERSTCHGIERYIANEDGGYITSKNFPGHYNNNLNCFYSIVSPENSIVGITPTSFHLENSSRCHYDKVTVYDGNTVSQANMLGTPMCGNLEAVIIKKSRKNSMLIWFHTDASITEMGFKFIYVETALGTTPVPSISCHGTQQIYATTRERTIGASTMSLPRYPGGDICIWEITAHSGSVVIKLDYPMQVGSSNCGGDTLTFYDVEGTSISEMRKVCGTYASVLPGHFSKGRKVKVVYYRHPGSSGSVFKFSYHAHSFGIGDLSCVSDTPSSRRLVVLRNGINIQSPGYPHYYPRNTNMTWVIWNPTLQRNSYIDVLDSRLEQHAQCNYDFVSIAYGDCQPYNMNNFGRFCGNEEPKYRIPNSEFIFMIFKTDGSTQYKGFSIDVIDHFKGTTTPSRPTPSTGVCSTPTRLTANEYQRRKHFPSPSYNYQSNLNCIWHVVGCDGHPLIIQVDSMEIELCTDCRCDSVSIYDGPSIQSPRIGKFCGSATSMAKYISTAKDVTVQFKSDAYDNLRGFSLTYYISKTIPQTTPCQSVPASRRILASSYEQFITSPNYPSDYPSNQEIHWLIYYKSDTMKLILQTYGSKMEDSNCQYDYVEIFDGTCEMDTTIGKFCGRQSPKYTISGEDRYIMVKFRSDGSTQYKGFKLGFKLTDVVDEEDDYTVGIAVGTSCGVLLIIVVVGIVCRVSRKSRRGPNSTVAYRQHSPPVSGVVGSTTVRMPVNNNAYTNFPSSTNVSQPDAERM